MSGCAPSFLFFSFVNLSVFERLWWEERITSVLHSGLEQELHILLDF